MAWASALAFTVDLWNSPKEAEYFAGRVKTGLWNTERLMIHRYFLKTDRNLDLVANSDYKKAVDELTEKARSEQRDLRNLACRMLQILDSLPSH